MLKAQGGLCAICGTAFNPEHQPGEVHKKPFPCVDHDHELRWLLAAQKYVLQHKHVLLDVKDPAAQPLLWEYAQRRRSVDAEFSDDLEFALRDAGFVPAEPPAPPMTPDRAREITRACLANRMGVHVGGEYKPLPDVSLEDMLIANRLAAADKGYGGMTVDPRGVAAAYAFEQYQRSGEALLNAVGLTSQDEEDDDE